MDPYKAGKGQKSLGIGFIVEVKKMCLYEYILGYEWCDIEGE